MIILCQCPLRVSLLGGGTDLDWYLRRGKRSSAIGFAIKGNNTVAAMKRDNGCDKGILNYSSREEYSSEEVISHPLLRAAMMEMDLGFPIELTSFGVPEGGSGLGGSSSFLVAVVGALLTLKGLDTAKESICKLASDIEVRVTNGSIGRQDHYLAGLGGVQILDFRQDDVYVREIHSLNLLIENYANRLVLVATGMKRSACSVLESIRDDDECVKRLDKIAGITADFIKAADGFSNMSDAENALDNAVLECWSEKKKMRGVVSEKLLNLERRIEDYGCKVLKLLGAGGGGFFLVKGKDERSIESMRGDGYEVRDIQINKDGLTMQVLD